jgi:translation elongation factor EF-Tu-like GTPase
MSSAMNRTHIFTVEDSFHIDKRGLVLVGNCLVPEITLLPKQQLELMLPNGELVATEIVGVDYFTKYFTEKQAMGVLVTLEQKEQAPLGTKVYVQ